MAGVRKTVGVYERPGKRGFPPRTLVVVLALVLAAASGAAALFLL